MPGVRKSRLVVAAAALLLAATACSNSSDNTPSPTPLSSSTGASTGATGSAPPATDLPQLKIALISHAPKGDLFFDVIVKGAQDAAKKDNVDVKYTSSGDVNEQAKLIQDAIDAKVDGIAVSLPNPAGWRR